ncbi:MULTISPECIES: hypothetical protein [Legionella]|uniref:Yip1 domain-containing protein n=1 Tax=Legionella quinlivanii TaxID=45073 RepID=A0A364LNH5_9GAMM|nr:MULTISPECIES: hypothetical protein [Legionella]MCE3046095.1 hypothetical protein [Legionella sp. 16cNR16C]RAP38609.1 hypothetical protein B1207_01650 [Legionella quinlivanii]
MWKHILQRYWKVTTLKESPAQTPYSLYLLVILTLLFFIVVSVQWSLVAPKKQAFQVPFLAAAILLGTYFIYTLFLLYLAGKSERLVQTVSSLYVTYLIIHLLAFPLIFFSQIMLGEQINNLLMLLLLLIYLVAALFLTGWQFLVTANIYRHALDLSFVNGILACLGLMAFSLLTLSFIR